MRKLRHFALYEIRREGEYGFIPEEYSKFKHGALNIARRYGYNLAEKFIADCFADQYGGEPIVILPSAYSHIPAASFHICKYFTDRLNIWLFENNFQAVEEAKIYRTVSYRDDYGLMSAEQRYNLICGDEFHVDKALVEGKTLIHIDDIKITGTHERVIMNLFDKYGMTNDCFMLYFAELANPDIPPMIENQLNYAFVKSLDDVDCIIKSETFGFNTRVVKYILNTASESFDRFIATQSSAFIIDLYCKAIGNGYFKFPAYRRNLEKLRSIVGMH
ncbi:MAG: phosphoribosyltransferase family protein [Tannerellaceae bacterium]|jgi:hypothetical protein|nr:phosphoribosyltransferase family protein [Tannerellaceae bacterium]